MKILSLIKRSALHIQFLQLQLVITLAKKIYWYLNHCVQIIVRESGA